MWKNNKNLILILLIAALLRFACTAVVERQIAARHGAEAEFLFPDSYQFNDFAFNLLRTGEYRDEFHRHAWRTPVYSMMMGALYAVTGESPHAARLMTNLIGVLNVLLIYILAKKFFGRREALLAALVAAFYPFFIYFSSLVIADTLGHTAVLLAAIATAHWLGVRRVSPEKPEFGPVKNDPSYRRILFFAFLSGATFAFGVMVKAAFALLGGFVVLFLLLGIPRSKSRTPNCWRRAVLCGLPLLALGFAAGMAPWWIRNYKVFERFVPFSTAHGLALYESCSENADGGPSNGKVFPPKLYYDIMQAMRRGRVTNKFNHHQLDLLSNKDTTLSLAKIGWYSFYNTYMARFEPFNLYELNTHDFDSSLVIFLLESPDGTNDDIVFDIIDDCLCCTDGIDENGKWCSSITHFQSVNGNYQTGELFCDYYLRRKAQFFMATNPRRVMELMPVKIARIWNIWPNYEKATAWYYKAASLCSYLPVMVFAFCGLFFYRRRWREVYLLVVPAVYILCLHSIFMGSLRYRLPAMGCIVVLAAAGAVRIYDIIRARRTKTLF